MLASVSAKLSHEYAIISSSLLAGLKIGRLIQSQLLPWASAEAGSVG
jgi:hypothetical protein